MKYNYKEFIKQIVLIFLLFFMYQIVHAENPPAKLPPNVAKERDTINYILDKTQNYIKSKDWVNYDPKKEGGRSKAIGAIIQKHGYPHSHYRVTVRSYKNILTGKIVHWKVRIIIAFKTDKRYSMIEEWTIFVDVGKGKQNVSTEIPRNS